MADTKKKSNGKKTNSSKGKTGGNKTGGSKTGGSKAAETRRKNAQMAKKRKIIVTEVYLWISLAVALFLFLSNFGICGIVGNTLRDAMLGCFGWMGYVFPVFLAVTIGLVAYNNMNTKVISKIVAVVLLYVNMCLLFDLLSYSDNRIDVLKYYKYGSKGEFGGGLVGGALGNLMDSLLGLTGAYIVTFVVLIICIVILTEKSIMSFLKKKGKSAYESAVEDTKARKEATAVRREQKRIEKEKERSIARQKKIGVDFNETTVGGDSLPGEKLKDNKQEVHEIHIDGVDDPPSDIDEMPLDREIVYTYEENQGNKQVKIDGLDKPEPPRADKHATDGEFTPKERVIVSEEAKKTMKRKPFGVGEAVATETPAAEEVSSQQPKASSEGKIIAPSKKKMKYKKPPYSLLKDNPGSKSGITKASLMQTANKLKQVLANFGVKVEVTNVSKGPSVTRYELQPEMGTKVSRITGLADDIKLNMAAADIRIEAPIPGKAAVGIEIPNEGRDPVYLKELLNSKELREHKSKLAFPAGKDIAGRVVVADIAKMPHMLIAGTTGSGKSVFTNSILMSILYRTTPEDVRLIVIDPKVVEFQVYNKIPHLLYDVVTDPKKAAGILNWAVAEMTTRYKKFANVGARDIGSYNAKVESGDFSGDNPPEKMPQILIVIDELADLMMVAAKEVEEAICRLAQLARAAGIHMVIATQRPSVDVITGLIKANIPSRVALTVASGTDSRTIIDMNGAEKLLGNGDMLFYPAGYVKPVRVQGAYVSDKEIFDTVEYIKNNSGEAEYDETIGVKLTTDMEASGGAEGDKDPLFAEAGRLCIEKQKGSTSMIQRQFRVGFNRAARIMEQLYDAGVVGQEEQNKPRKVIMSLDEFEASLQNDNQ